ncbi:MAG: hypothetical protein K9H49_02260 [Bacteroidales bacterium]|nr:hypothetical protein [Bacteroidales bacterium]MCF8403392.1 hypothetical protein [Bacteroidales bacterium]
MKKYFIIVLLFLPAILFARLAEMPGYIISNDGDTSEVLLKIRLDYQDDIYFARVQYGVFLMDSNSTLKLLKPGEIKEFGFHYLYKDHKFVSVEYFNNYFLFLYVIIDDGPLKLFAHYKDMFDSRTDYGNLSYFLLSFPASSQKDFFCFLKPDGSFIKYSKYSGKKRLADFFSDYPELQAKIKRGLYKYTAVYHMVREYNKWYTKNVGKN